MPLEEQERRRDARIRRLELARLRQEKLRREEAIEDQKGRARVLKRAKEIVNERRKKIEELKAALNKKGQVIIKTGDEIRPITCLFTGWHKYDFIAGGDPKGHFTIDYGVSGAGKSTWNYRKMAIYQKQGIICIVVPMENGFDPKWCEAQGVNMKELMQIELGDTFDSTCDNVIVTLRTVKELNAPVFILVDSIHGQMTQKEAKKKAGAHLKDKSISDETPAALAQRLSAFIRRINKDLYDSEASMTLIGQAREKMDIMSAGIMLSGGNAIKHGAFRILQWRVGPRNEAPVRKINGEDVVAGHMGVARVEKTKLNGNLGQEIRIPFLNMIGPSIEHSNVDAALVCGVIAGSGAHYNWDKGEGAPLKFHGATSLYTHFESNPTDAALLLQQLKEKQPLTTKPIFEKGKEDVEIRADETEELPDVPSQDE